MTARKVDVIVVGLGAYGAAVALQAARAGLSVLGVDRFHPPHTRGSSHGETRITRLAVGEGQDYVPLARRSHQIWRDLEEESGETLLIATGGLVLGAHGGGTAMHGQADFLGRTISLAREFAIPHRVLDAKQIRRRFPALLPTPQEIGYLEPEAGLLIPERCIRVQLNLARGRGADLRLGEAVLAIESFSGGVRAKTENGDYTAERMVIAAGAWTPALLGAAYARRLTLHRQTVHWFPLGDPALYSEAALPVFIWMHGAGKRAFFYGFPQSSAAPHAGVKLADEQFDTVLQTPDHLDRNVRAEESHAFFEAHVVGRLRGLTPQPLRAEACIYTTAPQSRFLIDVHSTTDRIVVISACSGHGFKHSPAIGEAVAAWLAAGLRPAVLAPFKDHG